MTRALIAALLCATSAGADAPSMADRFMEDRVVPYVDGAPVLPDDPSVIRVPAWLDSDETPCGPRRHCDAPEVEVPAVPVPPMLPVFAITLAALIWKGYRR